MLLTLRSGGRTTLSVTDGCQVPFGDGERYHPLRKGELEPKISDRFVVCGRSFKIENKPRKCAILLIQQCCTRS